jgi:dTDP-4-dehydrorhamnose 3,5-epimerase
MVRFDFIHEGSSTSETFIIGEDNYKRLTVYPGVWMSFTGLNETPNIILNISNIEHNPSEALNLPFEHFKLTNFK